MSKPFIPNVVTREIPYVFTKKSRQRFVSEGRRSNEDERYQKWYLSKYLGLDIGGSTHLRCNLETGEIKKLTRVMHLPNCHRWTEDFDGAVESDNTLWSLKMIPESGGAQTRSIREVMHHIEACVKNIITQKSDNNFIFVLDGAEILKYKDRMIQLIPEEIKHRFIIGPVREVVDTYEDKKKAWTILHN
tara:strand:+ start:398 stop:964 length:567 start_codon:yes stop_codon:yes gene_type:complete